MSHPRSATRSRRGAPNGASAARRLGGRRDVGAFASTLARGVAGGACAQSSITRAALVARNVKAMGNDAFTYDLVSRMATASVTASDGQHTQSVSIDPYGNVYAFTNDGAVPTPAPTTTPATNHLANATYDGAGNMLGSGGLTFGWDGFNQLQTVQGTGILRYNGYSASGERVLMRDQNTTTITLRGLDNKVLRDITYDPTAAAGQQWRWAKDYVYRDGSLLASVSATDGIRHYTLDHLGSARLLTDRCGERKKLFAYLPFGQEVPQPSASNPEDKERMRFTVHERDLGLLDTGADDLDYMHARTYGPSVGRFLSVDPGRDWEPQVPNSWNQYAYVRGNPLRAFDATGRGNDWAYGPFSDSIPTPFHQSWQPANTPAQKELDGAMMMLTVGAPAVMFLGAAAPEGVGLAMAVNAGIGVATTVPDVVSPSVPAERKFTAVVGMSLFSAAAGRIPARMTSWAITGLAGFLLKQESLQRPMDGNAVVSAATSTTNAMIAGTVAQAAPPAARPFVSGLAKLILDMLKRVGFDVAEGTTHYTKQMDKGPVTHQ